MIDTPSGTPLNDTMKLSPFMNEEAKPSLSVIMAFAIFPSAHWSPDFAVTGVISPVVTSATFIGVELTGLPATMTFAMTSSPSTHVVGIDPDPGENRSEASSAPSRVYCFWFRLRWYPDRRRWCRSTT